MRPLPLMKKMKALNVYQINLYKITSFMYQVKSGTIPKIFNNDFPTGDHSYSTHFSLNSFQPPRSLKTSSFSINFCGPKIWNDFLSNDEKNSPTLSSFKQTLKKQDS